MAAPRCDLPADQIGDGCWQGGNARGILRTRTRLETVGVYVEASASDADGPAIGHPTPLRLLAPVGAGETVGVYVRALASDAACPAIATTRTSGTAGTIRAAVGRLRSLGRWHLHVVFHDITEDRTRGIPTDGIGAAGVQ